MSPKVFFTADSHFFHEKLAEVRGYDRVDDMNEDLINEWNITVGKKDIVRHLGDLSFGGPIETLSVLNRLNGRIHLLRGNHDKVMKKPAIANAVASVDDVYMLTDTRLVETYPKLALQDKIHIWLSHYRHLVWPKSQYGSIHLYGHSHGKLASGVSTRSMDVGVDAVGMAPVSMTQVLDTMAAKTWKKFDDNDYRELMRGVLNI